MGSCREACAGGIMLSFVCELFRYVGEALVGVFLGIIGFCVGILPLLVRMSTRTHFRALEKQ